MRYSVGWYVGPALDSQRLFLMPAPLLHSPSEVGLPFTLEVMHTGSPPGGVAGSEVSQKGSGGAAGGKCGGEGGEGGGGEGGGGEGGGEGGDEGGGGATASVATYKATDVMACRRQRLPHRPPDDPRRAEVSNLREPRTGGNPQKRF